MTPDVNLKSVDAMFATVLAELSQVKKLAQETRDLCVTNERRVLALEQAALTGKSRIAGAVAALSLVVGTLGWAVKEGIHRLFGQ